MAASFPSRIFVLLTAACVAATAAFARPPLQAQLEQSVKAAFLTKFARYVGWPSGARAGAGEPVTLCVIGNDPFDRLLDRAAAGQRIGDNPILVRRLASAERASGCHIAFVRGGSAASTAAMLRTLSAWPVLTVTDARYGGPRGMVHFAIENGRVAFHIDDAAAARGNLAMSSRLLALAASVRQR